MTPRRARRRALAVALVLLLAGSVTALRSEPHGRLSVVAYFDNTNGVLVGDEVRILGVPVGKIEAIEPQPERAKVSFWVDDEYPLPVDVKAVIVAPSVVTARALQLTPAYTGGPALADGAVIPENRTAVPVEWDDFREQLGKLTKYLQPTEPGGVSTLGAFVNTAAANLHGQGANIRDTIIKLSEAFSILGDHSEDIFATVKNVSVLVAALQSSTELMADLNRNLAAVSALLANGPDEVGQAVADLNAAAAVVSGFVADNTDSLGTTSDKLTSVSVALVDSLDEIKQALHAAPTVLANLNNIYEPAHGSLTGALALNNFANPLQFICSAVQAASRMNNEQSAKLCVQYLAPIMKNRQYNFLPFGLNLGVNAQARPNEVTYSEDWLRPLSQTPAPVAPLEAESAAATDPAAGLPGLMMPHRGG